MNIGSIRVNTNPQETSPRESVQPRSLEASSEIELRAIITKEFQSFLDALSPEEKLDSLARCLNCIEDRLTQLGA